MSVCPRRGSTGAGVGGKASEHERGTGAPATRGRAAASSSTVHARGWCWLVLALSWRGVKIRGVNSACPRVYVCVMSAQVRMRARSVKA
jgi:hypothetical protein